MHSSPDSVRGVAELSQFRSSRSNFYVASRARGVLTIKVRGADPALDCGNQTVNAPALDTGSARKAWFLKSRHTARHLSKDTPRHPLPCDEGCAQPLWFVGLLTAVTCFLS